MAALYGHTWASQYGGQPEGAAADTWAATLAGLSGSQMAQGLRACIAEGGEFPPSAPRFRAMCLGIPSLARVKLELADSASERSAFARLVWHHIDGYAYRQASAKDAGRMVQDAYELASERVMQGEPLPGESPAIEQPMTPKAPVLPGTREARCAHLKDLLTTMGELYNPRIEDPSYEPPTSRASAGG